MLQVYNGCIEDNVELNVYSFRASLLLSARTAMRTLALIAAAAILLACGRTAMAGSTTIARRAVEPVIAGILAAWNGADAHAIAAQYEARGDFVSPDGMHAQGRQEIETFYKGAFSRGYAGSRATAVVSHVRDLTGHVALVDGAWTIEPTGASKVRRPEAGLFFAVLHWQHGRWWIAALREQSSARTLREIGAFTANPPGRRPWRGRAERIIEVSVMETCGICCSQGADSSVAEATNRVFASDEPWVCCGRVSAQTHAALLSPG